MPYVNQESRERLQATVNAVHTADLRTAGELTYLLTHVCLRYLTMRGQASFELLNTILGAVGCCEAEFRRRYLDPYEDAKLYQNGDVVVTSTKPLPIPVSDR